MASASPSAVTPIIIKKVKKGGHAHHGGAWKVAFADFVTAMMAFFLLMWLLGSTTPEQKASISSYFNDPLATAGFSGNGAGNPALNGGDGILSGRGPNPFTAQSTDTDADTNKLPEVEEDEEALERARMVKMLEELRAVIDAGKALEDFADQILFDITDEGLRIQIIDKENRAMFDQGKANLKDYTRDILHEIVKVIDQAPNRISVSGHTDASQYAAGSDYGNWELSADRANAARRELIAGGLAEEKVGRVVGLGPSDLLDPEHPEAPLNRRISIVVLRGDYDKKIEGEGEDADSAEADAADGGEVDRTAADTASDAADTVAPQSAAVGDGDQDAAAADAAAVTPAPADAPEQSAPVIAPADVEQGAGADTDATAASSATPPSE